MAEFGDRFMNYETIHEMDDGEAGSVIGFHVFEPVDIEEIQAFLDRDGDEYGFDDTQHWDVREGYVGTSDYNEDGEKMENAWLYVYSNEPKSGYRWAVIIEQARIPAHWCVFHPMEPYTQGVPADNFASETIRHVLSEPSGNKSWGREDMYVYLCRECAAEYHIRYNAALKQAHAELEFEKRMAAA